MDKAQLTKIVTEVVIQQLGREKIECKPEKAKREITVGISNRHVHLSQVDLEILFGPKAELTRFKDLSQPGQFSAEQKVTLVGPKGVIEKVRVLGPVRKVTQVEISVSDCFKLGVRAPIRDSGDLADSAGLTLVGPKGSVTLKEGAIIAARHIHMHPKDADYFQLKDGDRVNIRCTGPRGVMFSEVLIRVSDKYSL
ncbi:MAG: phosphate propanoyltransferase, partial [Desulfitobacteriaceae bacterium]|nr:phosphate propanoyltransferase [Desulfitobacteriaceae bacterium]